MKPISQKHPPDLSYLVRLCVVTIALQVDFLSNAFFSEDVMTPRYSFDELQA